MSLPWICSPLLRGSIRPSQTSLRKHLWQGQTPRLLHNGVVEEGDVVFLRPKNPHHQPVMTGHLTHSPGARKSWVKTGTGTIGNNKILGKKLGDVVESTAGQPYVINQPALSDYVLLSKRLVQPIYPGDANLIVSLLDLHPDDRARNDNERPLEILEAGTGQGALTLHLARAIHGMNNHPAPFRPKMTLPKNVVVVDKWPLDDPVGPDHELMSEGTKADDEVSSESSGASAGEAQEENVENSVTEPEGEKTGKVFYVTREFLAKQAKYQEWLDQRRAIIHTTDIEKRHVAHAGRLIKGFRGGIYVGDIEMHLGTVDKFIALRMERSPEPFLDHVILDMPSLVDSLESIEKALKPYGLMVVFYPSITQIMEVMDAVLDNKLNLTLEQVIELPQNGGNGGRPWDLRRVARKSKNDEQAVINNDPGYHTVCRPMVHARATGGGFVGVWRRQN